MKVIALTVAMLLAATTTGLATGIISCRSDGGASLYIQVGFGATMSVIGVDVLASKIHWSSYDVEADQMAISQAFADDETIRIDLTDPNGENILAQIRLVAAREDAGEGAGQAIAGILHIMGREVYPLVCEGP